MSASPEGRRLRPIRLPEIPLRVRQDAYEKILMDEVTKDGLVVRSLQERVALGIAAESPSGRVYWVSEEAYARESRKRTWLYAARLEGQN